MFCKAPIPGQVKTRLIPPLTPEDAAQLHCELTERTLQTATADNQCPVELWCAPAIDHPFFIELERTYPIQRKLQLGNNLGARMHHAFCDALTRFKHAILIGCDCPSLTQNSFEQSLNYLSLAIDCVIAPAEDGGYVLIGLNRPYQELFENIPWGRSDVLSLTKAKIETLKLNKKFLTTQWDVDTVKDLQKYHILFTR